LKELKAVICEYSVEKKEDFLSALGLKRLSRIKTSIYDKISHRKVDVKGNIQWVV
jgi:hypothetical protein